MHFAFACDVGRLGEKATCAFRGYAIDRIDARKAAWLFALARLYGARISSIARRAQSAERKALNLVVVGSNPSVGVFLFFGHLRSVPRNAPKCQACPKRNAYCSSCLLKPWRNHSTALDHAVPGLPICPSRPYVEGFCFGQMETWHAAKMNGLDLNCFGLLSRWCRFTCRIIADLFALQLAAGVANAQGKGCASIVACTCRNYRHMNAQFR